MIIHSHQAESTKRKKTGNDSTPVGPPSYSPDDYIKVPLRFSKGLANLHAGSKDFVERINPCGFCVRGTKNGSMTQEIFFDFCVHFVKHLPPNQDKGPEPHILFLSFHGFISFV